MGWASAAREASEQRQLGTWRVRRWTAYKWREGGSRSQREQRERHLTYIASLIERRLAKLYPNATVKRVRLDGAPQLMFELVLSAIDSEDASSRAIYRIGRGLAVKIPTGTGRHVRIWPPWGKIEVAEV